MKKFAIAFSILTTMFAQESLPIQEEIAPEVVLSTEFTFTNNAFPEATTFSEVLSQDLISGMRKTSRNSVFLNLLFPGLGHYYLGDSKTALRLMGTAALELGTYAAFQNAGEIEAANFSLMTFSNTINYSIYAAYRDARTFNGVEHYKYKMPTDSLGDLTAAPFSWSVIKKPEVWGGYLGSLAAAAFIGYLAFPPDAKIVPMAASSSNNLYWFPITALPVGIGEETLFRGFLQSWAQESMGPSGAILLTSLIFGAAHAPNALMLPEEHRWRYYSFSLPLITALGGYLGWLTQKNISLKESVALHTWYDFTLFSLSAVAQSAAIGCPSFSYSVEF